MPNSSETTVPRTTRMIVFGRSWAIRLVTDWLSLVEKPRLPCSICPTHLMYCT